MPKMISFRQGLLSVLFWSIISAAFIGPGTVTTASRSGAAFQLDLLWALVFSIVATVILQEAAARITIASGRNLGEIIALKYTGRRDQRLKVLLFGAVVFGCAAYQAGNMLGALSGLAFFTDLPREGWTLLLALICGVFLWVGNFRTIANLLAVVVALMGIAFCYVAFHTEVTAGELFASVAAPSIPAGSALLVIGLIGTTIVPYNLFLASGISPGQSIQEMRWGIGLAVLIGGLISIAIMVVGTQVAGPFSFAALGEAMAGRLGRWAVAFFGFGLFAAGLSSSITSPLAAAVTARSLFSREEDPAWSVRSRNFRMVWGSVLGVGLLFGLLDVQPIPAIILAQAINGILLPVVAGFLLLAVNDRALIPAAFVNSRLLNWLTLLIVGITCFLGLTNIWKAADRVFAFPERWLTDGFPYLSVGLSMLIILWLGMRIRKKG